MTPWTAAHQASLFFHISQSLLILMSIESGGQSIAASASVLLLPMSIKSWFPLGLTGLIPLQSKGLKSLLQHHSSKASILQRSKGLKSLLQHHSSKASILQRSTFMFLLTSVRDYWKTIAFSIWTLVGKVVSLLSNMLSRFVRAFLARSKHSWLKSLSTVILESQKIKSHCFYFLPFYLPWSDGTRCHDLSFLNAEFSASTFTSHLSIRENCYSVVGVLNTLQQVLAVAMNRKTAHWLKNSHSFVLLLIHLQWGRMNLCAWH